MSRQIMEKLMSNYVMVQTAFEHGKNKEITIQIGPYKNLICDTSLGSALAHCQALGAKVYKSLYTDCVLRDSEGKSTGNVSLNVPYVIAHLDRKIFAEHKILWALINDRARSGADKPETVPDLLNDFLEHVINARCLYRLSVDCFIKQKFLPRFTEESFVNYFVHCIIFIMSLRDVVTIVHKGINEMWENFAAEMGDSKEPKPAASTPE